MENPTFRISEFFKKTAEAVLLQRDLKSFKTVLSETLLCRGVDRETALGREDLLLWLNRYYRQTPQPVSLHWIHIEVVRKQPRLCVLFAAFQLGYPDRPALRIQLRLEAETPRFSVLLLDLDLPSALKLPNAGVSAPQPSFTMLEAAIDQETVGVYWEENLPLFYISSSLLKSLNFTYDEFYLQCQGQLDLLLYPDDVGPAKAQARQALQQANQFELTLRLTRRDRSVLWRQCRGFRFLTDQGRIAVLIFFPTFKRRCFVRANCSQS